MLYGWFISFFFGFFIGYAMQICKNYIHEPNIYTFFEQKNATFPRIAPILKGYILQY